jgi:hypothetical protein
MVGSRDLKEKTKPNKNAPETSYCVRNKEVLKE